MFNHSAYIDRIYMLRTLLYFSRLYYSVPPPILATCYFGNWCVSPFETEELCYSHSPTIFTTTAPFCLEINYIRIYMAKDNRSKHNTITGTFHGHLFVWQLKQSMSRKFWIFGQGLNVLHYIWTYEKLMTFQNRTNLHFFSYLLPGFDWFWQRFYFLYKKLILFRFSFKYCML